MGFGIKEGYVENPGVCYFVDDATATRGIVFQPDVYTFAEMLADVAGADTIVDVGCGWADKLHQLQQRRPSWSYVGVDFGSNIRRCRERYGGDWCTWIEHDLEQPLELSPPAWRLPVVICSDVIEHVADPGPLVQTLRFSMPAAIVISTPERDLQYPPGHNGPPGNPCHVREWNGVELRAYLESEGLNVRHVGLTRGNDRGSAMATQLIVCTP